MGADTSIEWATHTFNPWIGCEKVTAGCKNCYASVDTFARTSKARGLPLWGPTSVRHRTSEANWRKPLAWNNVARKSREIHEHINRTEGGRVPWQRPRVFCASLADVFEARPELEWWRADLWRLIEECRELDWLLLTKRPENVPAMVPTGWLIEWPSHVWLGTSVEDQEQADARIPHLLTIPASVRFLSLEPLLGPVDLRSACWGEGKERPPLDVQLRQGVGVEARPVRALDWIIIGGESGPKARPCQAEWARSLVNQGVRAGVPVFVKQLGAAYSDPLHGVAGRSLVVPSEAKPLVRRRLAHPKGADVAEWPSELAIRQGPERGARQVDDLQ